MNQKEQVAHYYRKFRAEGLPAEQAYMDAKRHLNFRKRLAKMVAEGNRRSRAAKKGWKKRKAQ